jgi:hypothetical protein
VPSDPGLIHGNFGRDTRATVDLFRGGAPLLVAPKLFLGERPKKTNNRPYINYRRYAGQLIGCCVGEGTARGGEYLTFRPGQMAEGAPPAEGQSLSALYAYYHGRKECASRGINLDGEGCIVSVAADAAGKTGFSRYGLYPTTDDAYRSYSDRNPPPADAEADGKVHVLKQKALLTSEEQMKDYLAAGFVLTVGTSIPQGMMQTDDSGRFRWKGRYVGGHCYEIFDYDDDAGDWLTLNSWDNARWGERTDEPGLDPRKRGHTGIGRVAMDEFKVELTPAKFASGETEVVVYTDMETWTPKVRSFAEAF